MNASSATGRGPTRKKRRGRPFGRLVLTLAEAADRLGIQAGTLRVQIAKGKLKAKKMGRDWFVSEREVTRYERENRR